MELIPGLLVVVMGGGCEYECLCIRQFTPFLSIDLDYENANRLADVDVELMAFQSIIGDDFKGRDLYCYLKKTHSESWA